MKDLFVVQTIEANEALMLRNCYLLIHFLGKDALKWLTFDEMDDQYEENVLPQSNSNENKMRIDRCFNRLRLTFSFEIMMIVR